MPNDSRRTTKITIQNKKITQISNKSLTKTLVLMNFFSGIGFSRNDMVNKLGSRQRGRNVGGGDKNTAFL